MSRIGRLPISIPSNVQVSVTNGSVEVQGPKGRLVQAVPPAIRVGVEGGNDQSATSLTLKTSEDRMTLDIGHRTFLR